MQTDVPSIQTLSASELLQWRDHPSHLFESAFDGAIIGTTVRRSGDRVLVYDEERLIELAVERLKDDAESGEEILREDGAMWVTDGLDAALNRLGDLRPLLLAGDSKGRPAALATERPENATDISRDQACRRE